jgi:prefoldin subunit 5
MTSYSVINTYETAIERFTADRDSASKTLGELTNRIDNLKTEIAGLDSSLSAHYEALGRIHYEARAE